MLELLIVLIILSSCFGVGLYITRHDRKRDYLAISIATVVPALAAILVMVAGWYSDVRDINVLNGFITSKEKERVGCSHSYPCNCRKSGKGTSCDVCHLHPFDWDWVLHTNINKDVVIDRVDLQGSNEPPRYRIAKIGDPVSLTESYINYIKASEHSLFNDSKLLDKYKNNVPDYPSKVYDYHYIDRVLTDNVTLPNKSDWNKSLADSVKELGSKYQVNTIILFTNAGNQDYYNAVRQKWIGGKKNDVIVIIGTPDFPNIEWVRVLSWTDNELFKVELRDDIYDLGKITTPDEVMSRLTAHISKNYVRKQMKDFEYLKDEVEPEPEWYAISIFLAIALCFGIHYWTRRR